MDRFIHLCSLFILDYELTSTRFNFNEVTETGTCRGTTRDHIAFKMLVTPSRATVYRDRIKIEERDTTL